MPALKDLTGQKLGAWTVLARAKPRIPTRWRCRCRCGRVVVVIGSHLIAGRSRGCGCDRDALTVARFTKHGHSPCGKRPSKTYTIWQAMHQRCGNPKATNYTRYGGAGIRVCARWSGHDGFANFLADMGEVPKGKSIDRFPDKWGDYEPGNCRWATREEQAANKRPRGFLKKMVASTMTGAATASHPT